MLLPFTTRQLADAINESIKKYDEAEDKEDQCDPDVPIVILVQSIRFHVLSYGGDENEDGLVLEVMKAK